MGLVAPGICQYVTFFFGDTSNHVYMKGSKTATRGEIEEID